MIGIVLSPEIRRRISRRFSRLRKSDIIPPATISAPLQIRTRKTWHIPELLPIRGISGSTYDIGMLVVVIYRVVLIVGELQ